MEETQETEQGNETSDSLEEAIIVLDADGSTETKDSTTEDDVAEEESSPQIVINPEEAESLDKTLTKEQLKWLQPLEENSPQTLSTR